MNAEIDKLEELLAELDSGGDRDVRWSERFGNSVVLEYEDGTAITVHAFWNVPPISAQTPEKESN